MTAISMSSQYEMLSEQIKSKQCEVCMCARLAQGMQPNMQAQSQGEARSTLPIVPRNKQVCFGTTTSASFVAAIPKHAAHRPRGRPTWPFSMLPLSGPVKGREPGSTGP